MLKGRYFNEIKNIREKGTINQTAVILAYIDMHSPRPLINFKSPIISVHRNITATTGWLEKDQIIR
jgi:hypothetical protein